MSTPDRSDAGTCAGCGAPVNMSAFAPCPHGVCLCDTCDSAASCDRCREDVEREALDLIGSEPPC